MCVSRVSLCVLELEEERKREGEGGEDRYKDRDEYREIICTCCVYVGLLCISHVYFT